MNLYEFPALYNNLIALLEREDITQDEIYTALENLDQEFTDKTEVICKLIRMHELKAEMKATEIKRLTKSKQADENKAKSLRNYLKDTLIACNKKQVKTDLFTVSVRKCKSIVLDEEAIEDDYFKLVKTIDKAKIKADLKEGKEVPGANYEESKSLVIR